jgi:hypothetical protein
MNPECLDCSHSKEIEKGNYCYMFKDMPKNLPCGQHDKFENQRKINGKLILQHPEILTMMIRGMGGSL